MNLVLKYKITTTLYVLAFLFGIVMSVVALVQSKYLLFLIALVFAYVAWDNTFCGNHARACGYQVKGHYVIPPFLKKK